MPIVRLLTTNMSVSTCVKATGWTVTKMVLANAIKQLNTAILETSAWMEIAITMMVMKMVVAWVVATGAALLMEHASQPWMSARVAAQMVWVHAMASARQTGLITAVTVMANARPVLMTVVDAETGKSQSASRLIRLIQYVSQDLRKNQKVIAVTQEKYGMGSAAWQRQAVLNKAVFAVLPEKPAFKEIFRTQVTAQVIAVSEQPLNANCFARQQLQMNYAQSVVPKAIAVF